ncbi:MAG: 50S ribosomal protein L11 methyltransferase [Ferruginibacter sp.]
MQKFTCISFNTPDKNTQEQILALLGNKGYDAFEEKDDCLLAFIEQQSFDPLIIEEIAAHFKPVSYDISFIENQNWNQQWESSFEPVLVGSFAAIRASFHPPIKDVLHEIIITPKMSFGTGHHATTFLVMKQMQQVDFAAKHVIDFGTGTGVLAILAEKLGAVSILAIDNDEWSINNARENIEANHAVKIELKNAGSLPASYKADIILANINLNVILANLAAIAGCCNTNATVIFSGLLAQDEKILLPALETHGFHLECITQKGDWIALRTHYTKSL